MWHGNVLEIYFQEYRIKEYYYSILYIYILFPRIYFHYCIESLYSIRTTANNSSVNTRQLTPQLLM